MGSFWYGYRVHEQEIIISTSKIKVMGLLTLSFVFFNASLISVLYFAESQDLEDLILSWVCLVIFGFSCIVGSASLFRKGVPKPRISEEKVSFGTSFWLGTCSLFLSSLLKSIWVLSEQIIVSTHGWIQTGGY